MSYSAQLTIQPNTPKTSLSSISLEMFPCIITGVWLYFPDGCAGLVGCQVRYQSNRILPQNPNSYYISDSHPINLDVHIEIDEEPFSIEIVGYNLDDKYPHTIYINVNTVFETKTSELTRLISSLVKEKDLLLEAG